VSIRKPDSIRETHQAQADAATSVRLATFDQFRSLLFSIAYRMLGSVADSEDMLQETFIRWQHTQEQEIRSPRAFLVTIISRLCINHLQSARLEREEYVGEWLPEPIVTGMEGDPFNLMRVDESLSMAFLVLLERLTPVERAVFLLREIFDYSYAEVAAIINQAEPNCRQILHRAKQRIVGARPRFAASKRSRKDLLDRFLEAIGTGEMSGLIDLLAKDVVLHSDGGGKGLAVPNEVHGADKVARGILGSLRRLVPKELTRRLAYINGEPGLVNYLNGKPHSVLTIHVVDGKIRAIYIITNPEKLEHIASLP